MATIAAANSRISRVTRYFPPGDISRSPKLFAFSSASIVLTGPAFTFPRLSRATGVFGLDLHSSTGSRSIVLGPYTRSGALRMEGEFGKRSVLIPSLPFRRALPETFSGAALIPHLIRAVRAGKPPAHQRSRRHKSPSFQPQQPQAAPAFVCTPCQVPQTM